MLRYEWRIEDITADDGDTIQTWTARAGSINQTQATVASRPVYIENATPTGKATLRFDGTDDSLQTASGIAASSAKHIFVVAAYRPSTPETLNALVSILSGSTVSEVLGSFSGLTRFDVTANRTHRRDGAATTDFYLDGRFAIYEFILGTAAGSNVMQVGRFTTWFGTWDVSYIGVYDAEVTGDDLVQARLDLADRYFEMSTVSVEATEISDWTHGGASATLRIFADQRFVSSDGVIVLEGDERAGQRYKNVSCTVSGTTLSIPAYNLHSTTNSSNYRATYSGWLYDANGVQRTNLFSGWTVPTEFGSEATYLELESYNNVSHNPRLSGYATVDTVINLIRDGRTVESLSSYDSFTDALEDIGSTPFDLFIDEDVTISTDVVIPSTLTLHFVNGATITNSGGSLEFEGMGIDNPLTQIAYFEGFEAGEITWSGTDYPREISNEIVDTGNVSLNERLQIINDAFGDNYVKIVCHPRTITGVVTFNDNKEIFLTPGDYLNTRDDTQTATFKFNDNFLLHGSTLARLWEPSASGSGGVMFVGPAGGDNLGSFTNVAVRNLTFVGVDTTTTFGGASTIQLANAINCEVTGCIFDRTHRYAVHFGGHGNDGFYAYNGLCRDNLFLGVGIQVVAIVNAKSIRVADNFFNQNESSPFGVAKGYTVIDLEPNLPSDNLDDIVIENNVLDMRDDQGGAAVNTFAILAQARHEGSAKNITIRNNTIYGGNILPTADINPVTIAIRLAGVTEGYVYGNTIRSIDGGQAIGATGKYLFIHDNTIIHANEGPHQIWLQAVVDSNIYNNTIKKVGAGTYAGIHESEVWYPVITSGTTIEKYAEGLYTSADFADFFVGHNVLINDSLYEIDSFAGKWEMASTTTLPTLSPAQVFVDIATDTFSITGHNYVTGALVWFVFESSGGRIPAHTPLPDSFYGTNSASPRPYYIIRVDANTVKLATTKANALAGTAINFTDTGVGDIFITPMMLTQISSNRFWGNKAEDGIVMESTGSSQILDTADDSTVTEVNNTNYTATAGSGIILYTALTASRTVTLPTALGLRGKEIIVKDGSGAAATYNIIVDANGSELIEGSTTYTINTNYGAVKLKSTGAAWVRI